MLIFRVELNKNMCKHDPPIPINLVLVVSLEPLYNQLRKLPQRVRKSPSLKENSQQEKMFPGTRGDSL